MELTVPQNLTVTVERPSSFFVISERSVSALSKALSKDNAWTFILKGKEDDDFADLKIIVSRKVLSAKDAGAIVILKGKLKQVEP